MAKLKRALTVNAGIELVNELKNCKKGCGEFVDHRLKNRITGNS